MQPDEVFSLRDKVAVVTGASSGIGLSISRTLAIAGAKVVLIARRETQLTDAVDDILKEGGDAQWVAADLTQPEALNSLKGRVESCFGCPQIVVNGAGVNLREPVGSVSWESWNHTLNLNLSVPFFFSRMFVDFMKEQQWGKIINVASLQSLRAFPNSIAYGSSKGGVMQLTRAMAETWSCYGITCNAIAPGFFPTDLTAPVFDNEEVASKMANQTAIGRNGRMEDLDGPIIFLTSSASDYVTGQTLYIDGGFTAK